MKSIKLFQSKWAQNNHNEDCRMDNNIITDKKEWVCICNDESESETESVLSEIDDDEREVEAIKKEQLKEIEDRKQEKEDRIEWADEKPQNHKTTTISKKIPEIKKLSTKPIKHKKKPAPIDMSIIPKTFHQKWYAVFGDRNLRDNINSNYKLEYNFKRLEREVIRKAMYLQDGMLFKSRIHIFNIHLICSNIYDYHYHISDNENCGKSNSCKSVWERNIKRIYQSVLHNISNYEDYQFNYDSMDFNDEQKQNKDNPNSNKKKYNNGNIKLPFLDLLFNGNKYGTCLMRKKRKEDCPLYLILIGFFDWLIYNGKLDDVVKNDNGYNNNKINNTRQWWEF